MRIEIWVSKCVHLHAAISHETWIHLQLFPGAAGATRGEQSLCWSLQFCVQRLGRMRVRPPWTPQLDLLCWWWTRSGRPRSPQHEDFVSVGHRADAGSTDRPLSDSLRRTPQGPEVVCWGWRHDPNTDWLFSSPYQGKGSSLSPSPPVEMEKKWIWHKGGGNLLGHNFFDSAAQLNCTPSGGLCFHLAWNETPDHMFPLNGQLRGERARVWCVCHLVGDRRGHTPQFLCEIY